MRKHAAPILACLPNTRKLLSYRAARTAGFREQAECPFKQRPIPEKPYHCWIAHSLACFIFRFLRRPLIEPGKPWQNGTNESFNGKFRDGCLSMEWFRNRLEAKVIIKDWRRHYNEVRPHSSLNYLTPRQFVGNMSNDLTTMARISSSNW